MKKGKTPKNIINRNLKRNDLKKRELSTIFNNNSPINDNVQEYFLFVHLTNRRMTDNFYV